MATEATSLLHVPRAGSIEGVVAKARADGVERGVQSTDARVIEQTKLSSRFETAD